MEDVDLTDGQNLVKPCCDEGGDVENRLEMERRRLKASLIIEYRPFLAMCAVTIYSNESTGVQLKARSSQLEMCYPHNLCSLQLQLPENFHINLTNLNEWSENEWKSVDHETMSIQCSGRAKNVYRFRFIDPPKNTDTPKKTVECLSSDSIYQLRCKECGHNLLENDMTFRRVMPLPTEGWQASSGDWFCHKHEAGSGEGGEEKDEVMKNGSKGVRHTVQLEKQQMRGDDVNSEKKASTEDKGPERISHSGSLNPQADEMFFSLTNFVINSTTLSQDIKKYLKAGSLLCPGCQSLVGKCPSSDTTAVSLHRVTADLYDVTARKLVNPLTPLGMLSRLVREQVVYNVTCQIALRSESTCDVILVWMMENDMMVYVDDFPLGYRRRKTTKSITFQQVHKVLYLRAHRDSSRAQQWSNDLTVVQQSVLHESLEEIWKCLVESTQRCLFAYSEDMLDGFTVGLIPAL